MSKAMQACVMLLCSAQLLVSTILAEAETEIIQTPAQFEFALRHSYYLLHITVVDDRTGESWTGCTLSGLLIGALTTENGEHATVEKATATALSNTSRVFHFSNPKALYNLTTVIDPNALSGKVSKACADMRESGCMEQLDLTGQFVHCGRSEK